MKAKKNSAGKGLILLPVILLLSFMYPEKTCETDLKSGMQSDEIIFPEIQGWELVQEYPVYYPENLWDYINGAADAYLSYQFIDLHIAEYERNDETVIKVEVYRHKSPDYSFGIYSQERSPDYYFQKFGTQGYSEESLVHFITGKYYVKVTSNSTGRIITEGLTNIAHRIAESLGKPGTLPDQLIYFPLKGKIPNTEKFVADNFLGHDFISRVFTQDYEVNDNEFIMFLLERDAETGCEKILESYYKFTGQDVPLKQGHHIITDRYNGRIQLIWEDKQIWGIMNLDDDNTARTFLELMREEIRKH